MKIRLILIFFLLTALVLLTLRNDRRILDTLYSVINPLKSQYVALTKKVEAEGKSYLFQKETIDRLRKENQTLHKRILTQRRYIESLRKIHMFALHNEHAKPDTIVPVQTISYVKLNTFSQILLTKPEGLKEDKIYGLIESDTVAGVAVVDNGRLYGYLVSDPKCRFAVYVGNEHAPGIAEGMGEHQMRIKYIPKWYHLKPGDAVVTSGLDGIFFPSLPVGTVKRVETLSAYQVAFIQTVSDVYHPSYFFLIKDPEKKAFDILPNTAFASQNKPLHDDINTTRAAQVLSGNVAKKESNATETHLKEEQSLLQTKADVVEPSMPKEKTKTKKTIIHRNVSRQKGHTLDLF